MAQNTSLICVFLFIAIALFMLNFVSAEITWTNYYDTTSVEFNITNPEIINNSQNQTTTKTHRAVHNLQEEDVFYGDWKCVSNAMQREVMINDIKIKEYGGVCNLSASENKKIDKEHKYNSFLIAPIIMSFLILITLILIILVLLIR